MHIAAQTAGRLGRTLTAVLVMLVPFIAANGSEVLWKFRAPTGYVDASPAVGDVNRDGSCDLVMATTSGSIVALGSDGLPIWQWDIKQQMSVPPTLANVTGDLNPEVLVVSNPGRLVCLDGANGNPIWTYNLPGKLEWAGTSIVASDVNKDGKAEIITSDSASTLVCLDGRGAAMWTLKEPGGWRSSPAVGDLNGDGFAEILIGSNRSPLVCVSHAGKELWRMAPDGASGTSPVIWDLDGDGTPEIVTAMGTKLTAVSAKGKVIWQHAMSGLVDAAISVADADGDGKVEVYAVDLGGGIACVSGAGKLVWKGSVRERSRRSPAVADVDGDGSVEIIVGGYGAAVYVFDANGGLEARIPVGGTMNATPTVVDLAGNGRLQVICPLGSGDVLAFQWKEAKTPCTVLWAEYRYNSTRVASPASKSAGPAVRLAKADFGDCFVGANTFAVRIENAKQKRLDVSLTITANGKTVASDTVSSSAECVTRKLSYTVSGRRTVTLEFACQVKAGGDVILRRGRVTHVVPFVRELAVLDGALTRLAGLLTDLADPSGLRERVRFLESKMPGYRDRVQIATAMSGLDLAKLRDELSELRLETARLLGIAEHAVSMGNGVFLPVCAANPWAPFGGVDEAGENRLVGPNVVVEAFHGEIEAAAVNVFNAGGHPVTLRVELQPLSKSGDKTSLPARDVITCREVVDVPTSMLNFSADALPLLNQGRTILVPAWGARQVWLSVDTSRLSPGKWTSSVRLRALDTRPREVSAPISIEVWKPKLPDKQALRLCHWGYVSRSVLADQPEAALRDQLSHGTNVFVGLHTPKGKFDKDGNLVGELDYKAHDEYVRRHAKHGIILFHSWPISGPAKAFEPVWNKAAVAFVRRWVKHLAEMGVGYDGFAFYPVDEPGLHEGLVDTYINYAKIAREADPKILMYTDPVRGASMNDLERMAPYVDIWCPHRRGYLIGIGTEKLAFIKSLGKTVWNYECEGSAKHQSPLGYYRGQSWLAWHHGLTGIGFWNYCVGKDAWYEKAEYPMIYRGDGVVPSKRWEAVRDGIEDYGMLLELKKAAAAAAKAGRVPKLVEDARRLLGADATVIAGFCGLDEDGTLPGVDGARGGRLIADRRWKTIQATRRKIAELLTKLGDAK